MNVSTGKKLNGYQVLSIAFGAMIGWSWILLTSVWINKAGVAGAMAAIFIVGLSNLLIAGIYGELASIFPENGGEHVYTKVILGSHASFICSWLLLLGYVSVVAFEIVVFPIVLSYLFPSINQILIWNFNGFDIYFGQVALGVFAGLLLTFINTKGIIVSANLQTFITGVIVIAGLFLIMGALSYEFKKPLMEIETNMNGAIGVAIMVPMMFVGFDIVAQTAREIGLAPKKIALLIMTSVVCGIMFYVSIIMAVGIVLGSESEGLELSTAVAAEKAWASTSAKYILILGGIAGIITTWNGFLLGASRLINAMAIDKQLPSWFLDIDRESDPQNPRKALWFIFGVTCMAPLFGQATLIWFINAGGLGVVIAYIFVTVSFIKYRIKNAGAVRPFKIPYWKLWGTLSLLSSLLLLFLYFPMSPNGLIWPYEWGIVLIWCSLGFILFFLKERNEQ